MEHLNNKLSQKSCLPEEQILLIIGDTYYQSKVVEAWDLIEIDEPIQIRKDWMIQNAKQGSAFWNINVALIFLADRINPANYLEVGVRTCGSLVPVLHNSNVKKVVGVDMWSGSYSGFLNTLGYATYQINKYKTKTNKQFEVKFIKGDSHKKLKELINAGEKFDLITIDGDHSEAGAWEDLKDAVELLNEQGAIVFDDIIHPSFPYLKNLVYMLKEKYPSLTVLTNSTQDNGCAIFLKNIDANKLLDASPVSTSNCWCNGRLKNSVHPLYGRCQDCGTLVLKQQPTKEQLCNFYTFDKYWHDEQVNVSGYPPIEQRAINDLGDRIPIWYQLLRKQKPYFENLLEIGCAHGAFLHYCQQHGLKNAIGVEVDEKTCEFARKHFNLPNVVSGLFPDVSLPFEKFDIVAGFDVIEHFLDPLSAMRKVADLLNDNGICFFQVPCYRGQGQDWVQFRPNEHMFLYDSQGIQKLFDFAGLELVETLPGYFPDDIFVVGCRKNVRNLLFIRTDSIGDNVLASSMLPYIREKYQNARVTILCQEHIAELYESCPHVDDIVTFSRKRAYEDEQYKNEIINHLRASEPQLVLNTVFSREPITDTFAINSNAPRRIAFEGNLTNISAQLKDKHNQLYSTLLPNLKEHKLELNRHRDFLKALNIEAPSLQPVIWISQQDEDFAENFFRQNALNPDKTIALFAGVQNSRRLYESYGAAISQVCKENNLKVIALGGQSEWDVNQKNLDAVGTDNINLSGRTTIRQAAAILKRCRLAVGAETALAHIACAVRTPNVILLGGGHFGRFMPYSPLTSIVCLPLDCFGCDWKCKRQNIDCIRNVPAQLITHAVHHTFENPSQKIHVFVPGRSLYKNESSPLNWKVFERFLNLSDLEIIPVNTAAEHKQAGSEKSKYLVTAIVSTYNSERLIGGCLEDLTSQTLFKKNQLEIVVVNSGSEQNEDHIIRQFQSKYPQIKYIKTDQRETIYKAWNRAIKASSGKYITNANADDRHCPTMLERLADELESNENIAAVYSHFYVTTVENQTWETKTPEKIESWHPPYSKEALLRGNFMGPQPMWRKSLHDEYGYFDEKFKVSGDYEFFLRVSQTHDFLLVPEPLGLYLLSPDSLQRTAGTRQSEDERIWGLYKNKNGTIIRRPFTPDDPLNIVLEHFLEATEKFKQGNFVTAAKCMQKYQSLIDYSKLPRTLNSAKENDNVALSVVIVTYNRNEDLKKCLQSLSNQAANDFNFEVIVVDNGQSRLDTFKQYLDRYINCPINFNLAEGRNIGAHFARGDIIVFLDDDAIVGTDYISSIKSAFDRFDIFGLRGRTYPKNDTHINSNVNIYDLGNNPFPSYCNQEGNSAFLSQVYKAMGGMDPLLFGHEGSDLTYRIIQQYKLPDRIIYWPDAIIYHDFATAEKFRQKKKIHRRNETYLKYKHDTNIFANRTDIEKYPLPLKQSSRPLPVPSSSDNDLSPISHTNHSNPKVSIVISCYNCEKFLPDCLDSIRNQTLYEWELFLLDDFSTDGTKNIIEQYSRIDERIKPYYFNDNKGPYVRRNLAIQQANSDCIIIQDADDIMSPAKLELLYEEIIKDDRLAVVGSFYRMFLDEFKGLEYTDKVELPITHDEIVERYASARYICWHGSAVIRKALFDTIGLYDENPYGADKLWLAKAAEYACFTNQIRFKNIPEYLTLKREHPLSQQGLLPTLDPRSRRAKYQTYWEYKLSKIREKIHSNPATDIKTELKNCKCDDYIDRYSCLFEQWENQPLDDITLCRFISRAVKHFNEGKFVRCIIILNSIEKISADVTMRFKNYDLLRAIAYYAIDRRQQCRKYLSQEIQNHNSTAAEKFIFDYFKSRSKTDVRKWCAENDKRYNLRMIDTEKESSDEQQSHNVPKWCISAWQDLQDDTNLSPPIAQVQSGPLVSVIIPAYNAADYIKKAIESVLLQNYQNFELIVINDGSTDQTEDIVRTFEDERIKCFYQENSGLANAHNIGIKNSKGTFIIKLDADDMMAPDFIAAHLAEFEKSPHADLVYCDDCLIDEDEKLIRIIKRPDYSNQTLLIRDLFRCGFPVVPFRTCIKRNVFDKIGLFDESLLVGEDYDMMRRFVKHGLKIHHLPAALYLRRMTTKSLSRQYSDEKAKAHFEVVRRFIDTFSCEELFPDVAWDKIAPQNRQLHVKCLAGVTCLTIARNYVKTNSIVCANAAFDLARSQLTDALTADPANQQVRQLLQKCESDRAACRQTRQHVFSSDK